MDILDRLLKKAVAENILYSTLRVHWTLNDVILFASPSAQEGRAIARLLDIFGATFGLCTNMQKRSIMPIFGEDEQFAALQREQRK